MKEKELAIFIGGAVIIYFILNKNKPTLKISNSKNTPKVSVVEVVNNMTKEANIFTLWQPPKSAANYLYLLSDASNQYGLPMNLLARVAMQESSFNPDIINGKIKSPAGAVGIMQIVPKWHPGVNPTDPEESIYYAAKFLKSLYKQFGNWKDALSAYNWGSGNLTKFKAGTIKTMPKETVNYYTQILKDVKV